MQEQNGPRLSDAEAALIADVDGPTAGPSSMRSRSRSTKVLYARYGYIDSKMFEKIYSDGVKAGEPEYEAWLGHAKRYVDLLENATIGPKSWIVAFIQKMILVHDTQALIHNVALDSRRLTIPVKGETKAQRTHCEADSKTLDGEYHMLQDRFVAQLRADIQDLIAETSLPDPTDADRPEGKQIKQADSNRMWEIDRCHRLLAETRKVPISAKAVTTLDQLVDTKPYYKDLDPAGKRAYWIRRMNIRIFLAFYYKLSDTIDIQTTMKHFEVCAFFYDRMLVFADAVYQHVIAPKYFLEMLSPSSALGQVDWDAVRKSFRKHSGEFATRRPDLKLGHTEKIVVWPVSEDSSRGEEGGSGQCSRCQCSVSLDVRTVRG